MFSRCYCYDLIGHLMMVTVVSWNTGTEGHLQTLITVLSRTIQE